MILGNFSLLSTDTLQSNLGVTKCFLGKIRPMIMKSGTLSSKTISSGRSLMFDSHGVIMRGTINANNCMGLISAI